MRRQGHPNVFTPEFLHHLENRDQESPSEFEAACAGPWQISEISERQFALRRATDPLGEPPAAIFNSRELALLLAAVYPLIGRPERYRLSDAPGERGFELQGIAGGRLLNLGWLRHPHPEILEALHLAEGFLRSPTALARLLEAASFEALQQAGHILLHALAKEARS